MICAPVVTNDGATRDFQCVQYADQITDNVGGCVLFNLEGE